MFRMTTADHRQDEVRANLAVVRSRIARACATAGRDPNTVRLIAVTKLFPVQDAAILADLGVRDLGESRDQEASAKAATLPSLTSAPVTWHFVGRLQTNKARSVARYADLVHSVDRPALVAALAEGAVSAARGPLKVLVQVSLDGDTQRGGALVEDVLPLADQIERTGVLSITGLMAVAPMAADPDEAFDKLASAAAELTSSYPHATAISAGMSGDLEAAVRHGATHLRIGTALLGRREPTFD
jgi:PLP dependent protein